MLEITVDAIAEGENARRHHCQYGFGGSFINAFQVKMKICPEPLGDTLTLWMFVQIKPFCEFDDECLVGSQVLGHLQWERMLIESGSDEPRLDKFGFHGSGMEEASRRLVIGRGKNYPLSISGLLAMDLMVRCGTPNTERSPAEFAKAIIVLSVGRGEEEGDFQAIFSMSGERSFQGRTVAFSRCWRAVPPWMSQGVIVWRVSLARQ